MFRKIAIILVVLQCLVSPGYAQRKPSLKVYESEKYSVKYRADWLASKEGEILNIYPRGDFGAVTISVYQGITFPLEETRSMLRELNESPDSPDKVKMETIGALTVFTYEYFENKGKLKWFAKAIRTGSDFYLITINIKEATWKGTKAAFFKVVESFKIKP